MEPLDKACKKGTTDQKRKNVKKIPDVPEWPAVVGDNQSDELDHLSPEWREQSTLPVLGFQDSVNPGWECLNS
jgi:hypothetical protein